MSSTGCDTSADPLHRCRFELRGPKLQCRIVMNRAGVVPECSDRRARESCALAGMAGEGFVEMLFEHQE